MRVPVPTVWRSFVTAAVAAVVSASESPAAPIVIPASAVSLGVGRLAVVVDPEPCGHDDEQPLRVERPQLGAEEAGVEILAVEQARDRAEILRRADHGDLDPEAGLVRGRDGRRQPLRDVGRRLHVREEHVLEVEDVAGRVAVGAGRRGRQPGEDRDDESEENDPAHHVTVNEEHERLLWFPARSIATAQYSRAPGARLFGTRQWAE